VAWHLYARGTASGVYLQNVPFFPTNLPADIRWGFNGIWNIGITPTGTDATIEYTTDGGTTWFPLSANAFPAGKETICNILAEDKELFNLRCTDVGGCTIYRALVSIAPQDLIERQSQDRTVVVPHDLLDGLINQDTVQADVSAGSIIYGNSTPLWDELTIGASNEILTVVSGFPAWATLQSNPGFDHNLLSAAHPDTAPATPSQGSLIKGNGTPEWDEFALGTAGQQIRVNAGGTDLEYFTPAAVSHGLLDATVVNDVVTNSPTRGSLVVGNATPLWDELVLGSSGQYLRSDGLDAVWASIVKADISDFGHNVLSADHTDAVTASVVAGDLIIGNATPNWDRLPIGTAGQVLSVVGGAPAWADPSAAGWVEIGRTTLGAAGDNISVTFTAHKYLLVMYHVTGSAGTVNCFMNFNNDTGANYDFWRQQNGGAWAETNGATQIELDPGTAGPSEWGWLFIANPSGEVKFYTQREVHIEGDGSPERQQLDGFWDNTAQITEIDVGNQAGGTDFEIGSEVVVWGHD
jgi:hypothetical protein